MLAIYVWLLALQEGPICIWIRKVSYINFFSFTPQPLNVFGVTVNTVCPILVVNKTMLV